MKLHAPEAVAHPALERERLIEAREALAGFRRQMRPLWDHFLKGSDD